MSANFPYLKEFLREVSFHGQVNDILFETIIRNKNHPRTDEFFEFIDGLFVAMFTDDHKAFTDYCKEHPVTHYLHAKGIDTDSQAWLYGEQGQKLGAVDLYARHDSALGFFGDNWYYLVLRENNNLTVIYGEGKYGVIVGETDYVDYTPNEDCDHVLNHFVRVRSPKFICTALNLRDEPEEYREQIQKAKKYYADLDVAEPTDMHTQVNCSLNKIGLGVVIGKDVIVHNSSIGDCASLHDEAYIFSSRIGINATVERRATIKSSHVGEDCCIREFASLYKSHVMDSVDIGDCTIMQKSMIGDHLDIGDHCDIINTSIYQDIPPYTAVGTTNTTTDPAFIQVVPMIVSNVDNNMVIFYDTIKREIMVQFDGSIYTLKEFCSAMTWHAGISASAADMLLTRMGEIGEKAQLVDNTAKQVNLSWPNLLPERGAKGKIRYAMTKIYALVTQKDEDYAIRTLAGFPAEETPAIKCAREYLTEFAIEQIVISVGCRQALLISHERVHLVETDSADDFLVRGSNVYNVNKDFVIPNHIAMFPILVFPGAIVKRFMVITETSSGDVVRIIDNSAVVGRAQEVEEPNQFQRYTNFRDLGPVVYRHDITVVPAHFEAATGGLVKADDFTMPPANHYGHHMGKVDMDFQIDAQAILDAARVK